MILMPDFDEDLKKGKRTCRAGFRSES